MGCSALCLGLFYFGGRYYDAEIGRFISRDPARDGRNWFVYCSNNPLIYVDPTGYMATPEQILDPNSPYYDEEYAKVFLANMLEVLSDPDEIFDDPDEAAKHFADTFNWYSQTSGWEIGAYGYYDSDGLYHLFEAYSDYKTNIVTHPLDIETKKDDFGNEVHATFHTHPLGEGEYFSQTDISFQVNNGFNGYVVTSGGKIVKYDDESMGISILP